MKIVRVALFGAFVLMFQSVLFADEIVCDPTTCNDPQFFLKAANTSQITILLSTINGHWLNIPSSNVFTYNDTRTLPFSTSSQAWQFQNVLNDLGGTVT